MLLNNQTKVSSAANTVSVLQAPTLEVPMVDGLIVLDGEESSKQQAMMDLNAHVVQKYQEAKDERLSQENIWLQNTRAWRGEYGPNELSKIQQAQARNQNSSEVFMRITNTKVRHAVGQIYEVIFSGNKFPLGIEPTPIPDGVAETVYLEPEAIPEDTDVVGFAGDGKDIPPGTTQESLLGGFAEKISKFLKGQRVVEGSSPDKAQFMEIHPAQEAATKMEKVIHDQLSEDDAEFALRKTIFECVVLGSGVFKGPTGKDKIYHHWIQNPGSKKIEYEPETKFVPRFDSVSCWNFYPDPHAMNASEWDYAIERHLLNRNQLRELKTNSTFNKEAINRILSTDPSYVEEHWENAIREADVHTSRQRYEVLEYWGYVDEELADRVGIKFSQDDVGMVNIWTCNGEVIRAVVNPFKPQRFPYYVVPYEEHPYQVWGIGIPENMKDTQALMNGHMRLSIDNLRLAGNVILEVNENQLAPGQEMNIYPGKIFRKQGGAPGQSIYGITIPDTSQSHMIMFDKARQLSDEETGIPSFVTGGGQVGSALRNAASMSMVMGASALNIKTVIRNLDHYLLQPLGEAIFQWNMQFNDDAEIRGDMEIVARGTSALMQREVQSQRLLSLVQVASNPIMAPFLNAEYVFKEIAKSMDIDPDKVTNSPQKAALYAQLLQGRMNAGQETGAGMQGPNGGGGGESPQARTGGINPADPSGVGGGNIGVGGVPQAGEPTFTG